MLFFKRKQPQLRALKLYSVSSTTRRPAIHRAVLLEAILSMCQELFGAAPTKFDIHGPYGIRKGQRVGIKAFRSKLERRGHDDYYAIDGEAPGSFGFGCLFDARTATEHVYSELVFWYQLTTNTIDVVSLASSLSAVFPSDYGFVIDLPADHFASEEAKFKRTLSGVSLKPNEQLFQWRSKIGSVLQGKVRGLYEYNFLNDTQVEELRSVGLPPTSTLREGLNLLVFSDPDSLKSAQARYAQTMRASFNA